MTTRRIDGIKFNVERLTQPEVEAMHSYLAEKEARLIGDLAFLETVMYQQSGQMPLQAEVIPFPIAPEIPEIPPAS
jgi:hypothetical protein